MVFESIYAAALFSFCLGAFALACLIPILRYFEERDKERERREAIRRMIERRGK